MALIKHFKETALPGTPVADSIYYVADANPLYMQLYVTSTAGIARRIPTIADITTLINTQIANSSKMSVVADITARNALTGLSVGSTAYVSNATGDATVASGAASYIVVSTGPVVWQKTQEFEGLDLVLSWANIQNKPASSVAAIDLAVTNSHTHSNKTQLDLIGQDAGGNLTYAGAVPNTAWITTAW
jgi:hypothetical protein